MKKRMISCILSLALVFSLVPTSFAASDEANQSAQSLYEWGLFQGTGTDEDGNPVFDLDRTPTRAEAVTMLVRLLGREDEAKNGYYTDLCEAIFTDVADWAKPYVGYAFDTGLTSGTGEGTFGGKQDITVTQYLTFALRALGYESGMDFQWDKAWELSDQIGLTSGEYNANTARFTRGDVAVISLYALRTKCKNSDMTLLHSFGSA